MNKKKIAIHREEFLVEYFQNFYYEVLRQKEFCLRYKHSHISDSQEKKNPFDVVQEIQGSLKAVLFQQEQEVGFRGGPSLRKHLVDAQYIMVALADEVFLNIDWDGKTIWEDNLLESSVFQSQMAGELIFTRLDQLIEENEPLGVDLAILYLLLLGLGFKGRFTQSTDALKINNYRTQLFEFIHRRSPNLYKNTRTELFAECYDHIIVDAMKKEIPEVRLWSYIFTVVLGTYLVISYGAWYVVTHDLESVMRVLLGQPISLDESMQGQL
jgi:type VI secretion system protein ImpK